MGDDVNVDGGLTVYVTVAEGGRGVGVGMSVELRMGSVRLTVGSRVSELVAVNPI
jgi:hypothetical protein